MSHNGQAQAPQLQVRYEYAYTPSFPQLKTAPRAAQEPLQEIYTLKSLIAKPSVVAGREHQWHIRYNPYGQATQVTETGYAPNQGEPITRTTTYTYRQINDRSLLTQIDGPLPNAVQTAVNTEHTTEHNSENKIEHNTQTIEDAALTASTPSKSTPLSTWQPQKLTLDAQRNPQQANHPRNSDITQFYYDETGHTLTHIIAPGGATTQLDYDTQGTPDAPTHDAYRTGGVNRHPKLSTHRRPIFSTFSCC